jgi:aromatic ring-opening dioxygenase catalytic subunit (LigB family)
MYIYYGAPTQPIPHMIVDISEKPKLIYDFYNFPKRYYEHQWDHKGSPAVASRVLDLLNKVSSTFFCLFFFA